MNKIKLFVSDVDGTLLTQENPKISNQLHKQIDSIYEKGWKFAIASGRQYHSLQMLFSESKQDLIYICENGSITFYKNEILHKTIIEPSIAYSIIDDLKTIKGSDILLSGIDSWYIEDHKHDFYHMMTKEKYGQVKMIDNLKNLNEDILKISLHLDEGLTDELINSLKNKWTPYCNVMASGFGWLDFCIGNKGDAIKHLLYQDNIDTNDLYVFGDEENDIEMLKLTKNSYVMAHGSDKAKLYGQHTCHNVVETLRNIIIAYPFTAPSIMPPTIYF